MSELNTSLYAQAYKELNPDQLEAVNELDGPLLVIAGPGTGKTQLLATRVGRILEQTDASPENILCLTFSDSATRAMKQRLASLIGTPSRDVTVSTYHSFGSNLISTYPERFNSQTLAAKPIDALELDKLMRAVQKELPFSNPLKNEYYLKDLKSLISGYKKALITPDLLDQILSANQAFMTAANKLVGDILKPGFVMSKSKIVLFEQIYAGSANLPKSKIANIVPLGALWLEELADALSLAQEENATQPLTRWKNKWLAKDGYGHFLVVSDRIIHKQQALSDAYRHYNQLLITKGLYDYDDMIMLAIKGLEDNPDLLETLQERYLYIQLDEFQDTNEAQLKLVELLANHPVNENRPNILAVGDDDQAIYSFQGAHYSHMERFYNLYRDVKLINLTQNYRSTTGIITLSDNTRSQINDRLNLTNKEQVSAVRDQDAEVIMRVELPYDVTQLAWVSDYIAQQIKDHQTSPSAIAVFASRHQELVDLIPYLHERGIGVNYAQKNNILADRHINELLAAARLAVNLNDPFKANELWPEVLSHAYWQVPTTLIWEIAHQAHKTKVAWLDLLRANLQTKPLALFFMRLNQIAASTPFDLMLNYLIGNLELGLNEPDLKAMTSPFFSYYFSELKTEPGNFKVASWQLLGQLSTLIAKAKDSSEQSLDLNEFVAFCDDYLNAKIDIIDNSPFREGEEAVNLMTAHSAKGQEFDTVILINCIDSKWGRKKSDGSSSIILPLNLAHVLINKNGDDEKLRLLFVATSRAKRKLILTSYAESLSGKLSEPLTYLNEYYKKDDLISPLLPGTDQRVLTPKFEALELDKTVPSWWSRHLDNFKPDSAALLNEHLANFSLSATSLNNFTDVTRGGPQQFFLDSILKFPSVQSPSAEYGSALHMTLDWCFKQTRTNAGKAPKLDAVLKEFEQILSKRYLNKSDFNHYLVQGKESLKAYLSQVDQTIGLDDLSEQSQSVTLGVNNDIRLNGKIDRLIINKSKREIKIIDFKSGSSYERWNNSDPKSFHHQRQLYFYKLLVEQSSKFKGYKVSSASLQFIEPDEQGVIKNLELVFNEEAEQSLLELITSVWNKIMTLDFPDTSTYKNNISGIKAFEAEILGK